MHVFQGVCVVILSYGNPGKIYSLCGGKIKRMFLVQLLFVSVAEPGKQQVVIGNNHITRDG